MLRGILCENCGTYNELVYQRSRTTCSVCEGFLSYSGRQVGETTPVEAPSTSPNVRLIQIEGAGLGVEAARDLPINSIIERCPSFYISPGFLLHLHAMGNDYVSPYRDGGSCIFSQMLLPLPSGKPSEEMRYAFILGYGMLYNHSDIFGVWNAKTRLYTNEEDGRIFMDMVSMVPIQKGTQILLNYHNITGKEEEEEQVARPLWFKNIEMMPKKAVDP